MGLLILFLIQFLYFLEGKGDLYNGKGYHTAVGIPKAYELMSEEGFVSRIVGGKEVTSATLYPYQAGIVVTLTTGQTSLCGGALVSNTRVLTAAHCWWDGQIQARQFTIVLGSLKIFSGGTRITTRDVVVHSNWNTKDITHDIAMAKISRVTYSSSIQAVPLPATSDAKQNYAGLTAVATGYGKMRDAQNGFPSTTSLHHINLKITTNAACQRSFDIPLHASHLCTDGGGRVGTCDGDSGGPLTVMWKNKRTLVGIVSFGLADGCQAGYPSVYTRVTSFLTWIQANL
ncbi:brachyurin-like [Maniola hyperantus]|uniref:brachyurin-like n=1 Tax=Aphantopus hyperantus TaxID=2795564 RepID=UPI00156951D1|nr:brachyurin-like [Maniola hyperantus]